MEKPRWRVASSSYAIETPFLRMRRDEVEVPTQPGRLTSFFVRESRGFSIVFALTPEHEVILVEQYRYGDDSITIELPAGTLDGDEDPLDCAKREMQEETGYTATRWEHVLDVAAEPVRSTSVMHVFVALDAVKTSPTNLDPFEVLESSTRPLEEVRSLLRAGGFGAAHSVAAAFAALDYLERNRLIGNG
jgi:8-oxo-dGTP pyrophosphatase MutT (NUDIX family)